MRDSRRTVKHIEDKPRGDIVSPETIEEKLDCPGSLVSIKDHNVFISYEGQNIVVPPRAQLGQVRIANCAKVGAVPRGVTLVPEKIK